MITRTLPKSKARTLTEREQFISEMRTAGKSYKAIGQMCDPPITDSRVEQIVRRIGATRGRFTRPRTEEDAKQYLERTYPTQLKQFLDRWLADGVCNIKALGEKVGLSCGVAYKIRKLYKLHRVDISSRAKISLAQRSVVCKEYVNGVGVMVLMRKYNVQCNSIYHILRAKFKTLEAAKQARDAYLRRGK